MSGDIRTVYIVSQRGLPFSPLLDVLVLTDVEHLRRGMVGWVRNATELDGVLLTFQQPGPPAIHSHGMLDTIDVVALDARWFVVGIVRRLAPGRDAVTMPNGTNAVLEVFSGAAGDIAIGDRLRFGARAS